MIRVVAGPTGPLCPTCADSQDLWDDAPPGIDAVCERCRKAVFEAWDRLSHGDED